MGYVEMQCLSMTGMKQGQSVGERMCGRRGRVLGLVVGHTVMQHGEPSLAFARSSEVSCRTA
jgi:hypothetical protein